MRIQNNVSALNAHRYYGINQTNTQKSIAKLSSGYRINSAADDAAGLAISEKMRAQIRGLTMASKNTQDGISLIQTAEGGMQEIDNMLQRIRELVNYASNDTQEHNTAGTGDRQKIQDEIDQLVAEIDSMSERVEFNKKKLISGEFAGTGAASSKTISRLQTKLQNAAIAESEALSTLNKAGDAYEKFTDNTVDTSPLGKALLDFFGAGAADSIIDTAGAWTDADATSLGNVTKAEYFATSATITEGGSALGRYADLVNAIGNAADSFQALTGTGSVFEAGLDPVADKNLFDFQNWLKQFNINDAAALTGMTAGASGITTDVDAWTGANASALVGEVLDLNVFAYGSGSVAFADSESLANIKAIAEYSSNDNLALTGEIKTIVDAAKVVAEAVKEFENYTAEGGAYDTAKKAYETAAKAEKTLYDGVKDKQNALDIARQEKNQAQRNLEEALAKGTPIPSSGEGLYFQVGANANQSLQLTIGSVKSDILGVGDGKGNASIEVLEATGSKITGQLDTLDEALSYVTTERSKLGAAQNRLEYTMNSLEISAENLTSAESRIRDVDMAKEMTNFTKNNILFQASIAMLAQANAFPQGVLQLLG